MRAALSGSSDGGVAGCRDHMTAPRSPRAPRMGSRAASVEVAGALINILALLTPVTDRVNQFFETCGRSRADRGRVLVTEVAGAAFEGVLDQPIGPGLRWIARLRGTGR